MLKEHKNLTSDSKMHKVAYDFMADGRWRVLEEHDREATFQLYIDELWGMEKKLQNQARMQDIEMLKCVLQEANTTARTKWDFVRADLPDNIYFKALHVYDRISTFIDYIMEAEKKADEARVKDKRIRERSNRLNFRNLLKAKLVSGELTHKHKWKRFVSENKASAALLEMLDP